jgi:hypothetical protein
MADNSLVNGHQEESSIAESLRSSDRTLFAWTAVVKKKSTKLHFLKMVLYEPMIAAAGDAATTFFEMANSNTIEYRCSGGSLLTIKQDRHIKNCTGGIVWETAFLLGTFLEVNTN